MRERQIIKQTSNSFHGESFGIEHFKPQAKPAPPEEVKILPVIVAKSPTPELASRVASTEAFESKYGITPEALLSSYDVSRFSHTDSKRIAAFAEAINKTRAGQGIAPVEFTEQSADLMMIELVQSYEGKILKQGIPVRQPLFLTAKAAKPLKLARGAASLQNIVTAEQNRFNLDVAVARSGHFYAHDGKRMVIIKDDAPTAADRFYTVGKGQASLITDTDALKNLNVPDFQRAVPKHQYLISEKIDIQSLIDLANRARTVSRNLDSSYPLQMRFDLGEFVMFVASPYVFDSLQALQANGAQTVRLSASDPAQPVIFTDDLGNRAVVMACHGSDTDHAFVDFPVTTYADPDILETKLKELRSEPSSEQRRLRESIEELKADMKRHGSSEYLMEAHVRNLAEADAKRSVEIEAMSAKITKYFPDRQG